MFKWALYALAVIGLITVTGLAAIGLTLVISVLEHL